MHTVQSFGEVVFGKSGNLTGVYSKREYGIECVKWAPLITGFALNRAQNTQPEGQRVNAQVPEAPMNSE